MKAINVHGHNMSRMRQNFHSLIAQDYMKNVQTFTHLWSKKEKLRTTALMTYKTLTKIVTNGKDVSSVLVEIIEAEKL